jgi:hypothetical protein
MKNRVHQNHTTLESKTLKIIHIQMLCNYPLGITFIVQLSF